MHRITEAAEGDKSATTLLGKARLEELGRLEERRSKLLPDDPQIEVLDARLQVVRDGLMHAPETFGADRLIGAGEETHDELEDYDDTLRMLGGQVVQQGQLEGGDGDGE